MATKKALSTAEVAKQLGITKRTLFRWLAAGRIPEPKRIRVGKLSARVWSDADVKRAQRALAEMRSKYGQGWQVMNLAYTHPEKLLKSKALLTQFKKRPQAVGLSTDALLTDPSLLLTRQQLAERLQVRPSWVFEQTRARAGVRRADPLPHIKLGKELRFSWPDIVQWLARQEKGGTRK